MVWGEVVGVVGGGKEWVAAGGAWLVERESWRVERESWRVERRDRKTTILSDVAEKERVCV